MLPAEPGCIGDYFVTVKSGLLFTHFQPLPHYGSHIPSIKAVPVKCHHPSDLRKARLPAQEDLLAGKHGLDYRQPEPFGKRREEECFAVIVKPVFFVFIQGPGEYDVSRNG